MNKREKEIIVEFKDVREWWHYIENGNETCSFFKQRVPSGENLELEINKTPLEIEYRKIPYTKNRYTHLCPSYIEETPSDSLLDDAMKYLSRASKKVSDKQKEDLEKAIWYIQRKIEQLDKES